MINPVNPCVDLVDPRRSGRTSILLVPLDSNARRSCAAKPERGVEAALRRAGRPRASANLAPTFDLRSGFRPGSLSSETHERVGRGRASGSRAASCTHPETESGAEPTNTSGCSLFSLEPDRLRCIGRAGRARKASASAESDMVLLQTPLAPPGRAADGRSQKSSRRHPSVRKQNPSAQLPYRLSLPGQQ